MCDHSGFIYLALRLAPSITTIELSSSQESSRRRKCFWCRMSLKDLLKYCSDALIPLMLGMATLTLALQQHQLGIHNRGKDLEIAKEQREQQLEIENRHRTQELTISQARQMDAIVASYLSDMSALLLSNNFTLTIDVLRRVAEPKTYTALSQLDLTRKTLIVNYLYLTRLISSKSLSGALSLMNADLSNMYLGWSANKDMSDRSMSRMYHNLVMKGAYLTNASFALCALHSSDFTGAQLHSSNFFRSHLINAIFTMATLTFVNFTDTVMGGVDLGSANLTGVYITDEQLWQAFTLEFAILPNGTVGSDRNYFADSENCSTINWKFEPSNKSITAVSSNGSCFFKAENTTVPSYMTRNIDVQHRKAFIDAGEAEILITMRAQGRTDKLAMYFYFINENITANKRSKFLLLLNVHDVYSKV